MGSDPNSPDRTLSRHSCVDVELARIDIDTLIEKLAIALARTARVIEQIEERTRS